MQVLGIETSCDETAAAIVQMGPDGSGIILSNIIYSQIKEHAAFGGVVPEIAARSHLSLLDGIIEQALNKANADLATLDAIAVTSGPGLVGGLLTGLMTAKALALATGKPLFAINHLEGHALTPRLTNGLAFPYLLLLVSGGHTQFIEVRDIGEYHRLATTIDDALGEAFDKTAKLLGLGYPGGPKVEQAALKGNGARFAFPRPLQKKSDLNFSFSGLKTAVRQEAEKLAPLAKDDINDICASFQAAVTDVLSDRTSKMIQQFELHNGPASKDQPHSLVIAGGVAANQQIREVLQAVCQSRGWRIIAPPLNLCTDNAAMIAWAGMERISKFAPSPMDTAPRSRWPLDEVSQTIMGGGRRGPKV